MPQSVFVATNQCSIDYVSPNSSHSQIGNLGVLYIGGKSLLRRPLATFNLFAAAAEGRALRASDSDKILRAEFLAYVGSVNGPAFAAVAHRLTRANYIREEATWNVYKTGSAWTSGGGDFATPPADAAFTSPAALGDQAIQDNLADHVADALANRGGLALLIWQAVDEDPGADKLFTWGAQDGYTPAMRLRVTYSDATPAPISRPPAHATMHGAPPARPARPAR